MFIENDRAEKDGGLFALFRISVCQYKLNLYAKETYYAYLKVYTTANPQTCICSCKIQPLSTVKLLYCIIHQYGFVQNFYMILSVKHLMIRKMSALSFVINQRLLTGCGILV